MEDQYTNVCIINNRICFRGRKPNGDRIKDRLLHLPSLWIEDPNTMDQWRSVDGKKLRKVIFNSTGEASNFVRNQGKFKGMVHGVSDWVYQWLKKLYPDGLDYDLGLVRIFYLDIEVLSRDGFPDPENPIHEISTIACQVDGIYYGFGCKDYAPEAENIRYWKCADEKELLGLFLKFWRKADPDVVTGWNVDAFDIAYLYKRMCVVLGEKETKKLSPWEVIRKRNSRRFGKNVEVYDIKGVDVLDYLFLYKKFSKKNLESNRLDFVSQEELGEGKVAYGPYKSLTEMYDKDFQKYMSYNIKDVMLVTAIEKKMHILSIPLTIAYDNLLLFTDPGSVTKVWDIIVANHLYDRNIIVPSKNYDDVPGKEDSIEGGHVKEPQTGYKKNVVSFDLNSQYPHLFIQMNISPETYRGSYFTGTDESVDKILEGGMEEYQKRAKKEGLSLAASGCVFDKAKKGFFPVLLEKMYGEREEAKRMKFEAEIELEKVRKEMDKRNAAVQD